MNAGTADDQHGQPVPPDEDTQALVEALRAAPAEEIITDIVSTLLSTAQVKLGRNDGRLFIDLCGVTMDHAAAYLSDDVRGQVDAVLGQLRMAQVNAERAVAEAGEPRPNDLPQPPAPARAGAHPSGSATPSGSPSSPATSTSPSGLWVPGR